MAFNPRDYYYIYDSPVPYPEDDSVKEEEKILIYPAMMREYLAFHYFASCLLLEKNSIPDPKIISMSYLEYLYSISDESNKLVPLMDGLLRLVLRKPKLEFTPLTDKRGKAHFQIDDKVYTSQDFDNIRSIVSEQNMFELPNELIQKEVRDKMEEARMYKAKMNNSKMASLEEQIIAVAIYTGWELEKIYDLSIRKFIKTLQRADHILHAQIYLSASMSGFVEFKDKSFIKHWLAEIEDNRNKDVTVSLDEVQSKVNLSGATVK